MAHYDTHSPQIKPRLIIHSGAGNILPENTSPEKYQAIRTALLTILCKTNDYMLSEKAPSALDTATHAVTLLEDCPLFNSAKGAVFTRDGINELEASVMVSRGHAKRAVGVMGLRRVRNPIELAKMMLERGDDDLRPQGLNVPSAQGHTQLYGEAAEQLARDYGISLVSEEYFFTQQRWDEHLSGLEKEAKGVERSACWAEEGFLPQGTCGAVALDREGVVCVATSTGGMTNKLTGRIGDTPSPGAGFWAEEWHEEGDPTASWIREASSSLVSLSGSLAGWLGDCLPSPTLYTPNRGMITTRSMAASGTGNGDSFLRCAAIHTAVSMARHKPTSAARAVTQVAGPGGELQRSAGDRWGLAGEGEGGMIGLECAVCREKGSGRVVGVRSEVLMDYNCGGMMRAWIDDGGRPVMSIWANGSGDKV